MRLFERMKELAGSLSSKDWGVILSSLCLMLLCAEQYLFPTREDLQPAHPTVVWEAGALDSGRVFYQETLSRPGESQERGGALQARSFATVTSGPIVAHQICEGRQTRTEEVQQGTTFQTPNCGGASSSHWTILPAAKRGVIAVLPIIPFLAMPPRVLAALPPFASVDSTAPLASVLPTGPSFAGPPGGLASVPSSPGVMNTLPGMTLGLPIGGGGSGGGGGVPTGVPGGTNNNGVGVIPPIAEKKDAALNVPIPIPEKKAGKTIARTRKSLGYDEFNRFFSIGEKWAWIFFDGKGERARESRLEPDLGVYLNKANLLEEQASAERCNAKALASTSTLQTVGQHFGQWHYANAMGVDGSRRFVVTHLVHDSKDDWKVHVQVGTFADTPPLSFRYTFSPANATLQMGTSGYRVESIRDPKTIFAAIEKNHFWGGTPAGARWDLVAEPVRSFDFQRWACDFGYKLGLSTVWFPRFVDHKGNIQLPGENSSPHLAISSTLGVIPGSCSVVGGTLLAGGTMPGYVGVLGLTYFDRAQNEKYWVNFNTLSGDTVKVRTTVNASEMIQHVLAENASHTSRLELESRSAKTGVVLIPFPDTRGTGELRDFEGFGSGKVTVSANTPSGWKPVLTCTTDDAGLELGEKKDHDLRKVNSYVVNMNDESYVDRVREKALTHLPSPRYGVLHGVE